MDHTGSPTPPAVPSRRERRRCILGIAVALVGGVLAGVGTTPIGDSSRLPLLLYAAVVVATSVIAGALCRAGWAPFAIGVAFMVGILGFIAVDDARFDLAHPGAAVGLSAGADVEWFLIVLMWAGIPAALLALLGAALQRAASRRAGGRAV